MQTSVPSSSSSPHESSHALGRGERLAWHALRGTHITVLEGSVHLRPPPLWLGERVLHLPGRLAAGQTHETPADGWLHIEADAGPATFLCRQAPLEPSLPFALLRAALGALSRLARPRATGA